MKFFHRLRFLPVMLLLQVSVVQAQNTEAALEFNNKLTALTDSLYKLGNNWGQKFVEARESGKFYSLYSVRVGLENFLNRKKMELLKMKDVEGSDKLRLSMLGFLFFESNMIENYFAPLEKLTASSTEAEIDELIAQLSKATEMENRELQKVAAEQIAYAERNGFTIEQQ